MGRRARRVSDWFWTIVGAVVFLGLAFWCLPHGGYALWVQHFGIPARVQIEYCKLNKVQNSAHRPYECTGVWRQDDSTERTVTVHGVNRDDTVSRDDPLAVHHKVLDVHIRGDQAYTDSAGESWWTIFLGLIGLVLGLATVLPSRWIRAVLRSRTARSDDQGMPPAQIT
jgi:hypothetical protein